MKRNKIITSALLIVLSAALIACRSEKESTQPYINSLGFYTDKTLKYENGLFYPLNGEDPFTGKVTWRYANDSLAGVMTYRDGHLVHRKRYYRNGQMMNEMRKSADELISSVSWFPSGQMKFKYENGSVKQWYENGQLQAMWETNTRGVLQGKATAWYPDGTPLGVEYYKKGKLDGNRILYDSTGTVTLEGLFRKGEQVEADTVTD